MTQALPSPRGGCAAALKNLAAALASTEHLRRYLEARERLRNVKLELGR